MEAEGEKLRDFFALDVSFLEQIYQDVLNSPKIVSMYCRIYTVTLFEPICLLPTTNDRIALSGGVDFQNTHRIWS
jgi:hypothetical protein